MTAGEAKTTETAASEAGRDFIRDIVQADLASGKHKTVVTRFPPEPNGYLHLGHAKAICLNFGIAEEFGGRCHLRFDDTNPAREEQEYIDAIKRDVRWLGFDWGDNLFHASDYFDKLYGWAEQLIRDGKAYVDDQTPDEMRLARGTLTEPGKNSPFRDRSVAENLDLFARMKAGEFQNGTRVLRAKIDMTSGNINLRDPTLYRIVKAPHPRTGTAWSIYPSYDYAHGQSDAIEGITHSICTLEFEDQRPFYDWLLAKLADVRTAPDGTRVGGLLAAPLPHQYEFARLNLSYVVLSKRKLIQLVEEKHVDGWDDPRLPTLVGARRRGYTPEGFRHFAERIGVSKSDSWIDYSVLEECMRDHLNEIAPRRVAVLDPVRLVIENYPENGEELCEAPHHPQKPEWGKRNLPFSRELWIEREDYMEVPSKGYFRLFPGNKVRLRYGFVIECTGYDQASDTVRCTYHADSKSGTPGSDNYKVKGNIHWLSAKHAHAAEVRLYDRLFTAAHPGAADRDFLLDLNPASSKVIQAQLEPALKDAAPGERFQFERHGYFVADLKDAGKFNRTVTLKDTWKK